MLKKLYEIGPAKGCGLNVAAAMCAIVASDLILKTYSFDDEVVSTATNSDTPSLFTFLVIHQNPIP